jgi:Glycoside hydrolase 123, catalytic domain/Glycoside hydrolase 123 N-terminal domain
MRRFTGFVLAAYILAGSAGAAGEKAAPGGAEVLILDGSSSMWRTFTEWGSSVILTSGGKTRGLIPRVHFWFAAEWTDGKPEAPWASPPPRKQWNTAEFDDGNWNRKHCPVGPDLEAKRWNHPGFTMWANGSPSRVARVFARGRFKVSEAAKVKSLKLRLKFHGGAIVYINGKEVARAHVLKQSPRHGIRGEPYPNETYVGEAGKAILGKANRKSTPADLANYKRRVRSLTASIPAALLRKGVNVLAVEVLRSAYKDIYRAKAKDYKKRTYRPWPWPWPHCRLLDVKLTSAGAAGVAVNAGRPGGVQLWQPHPWATVTGFDYGCAVEPVRPIRMVGFRGGAFSAQLVVSSAAAIPGVKVTTGELKCAAGSIPAENVSVTYGESDGHRFTALLKAAPSPVPVTHFRRHRKDPGIKAAAQPLWVTVKVPRDTKPGKYTGSIKVEATGLKATTVPVEIVVHDWLYPEVKDLASHNNIWQCHEVSALRYNVPLWSDEHFALIGKCLELTRPLANRICNIPMTVGGFQVGNTQSMVRWIPKANGKYDYDFKIFDRYLDVYAKSLGKPRILVVDACVSVHSRKRPKDGSTKIQVSRLDPKTGKVEPMGQPKFGTPESIAFWKPVLTAIRKRLEKRGWWDVAVLGTASDSGPTGKEAKTFKAIWPDRGWIFSGHPRKTSVAGKTAPVKSLAWVWGNGRLWMPSKKRPNYPRPWKSSFLQVAFPRTGCSECTLMKEQPLRDFRVYAEKNLQCGQSGIGRVGVDFWTYAITDGRGRKRKHQLHLAGGQFSYDSAIPYFVAPGAKGPVLTTRGELYREGLQVREAMTYLLKKLDGGKLPAALSTEINALIMFRAKKISKIFGFRNWREDENRLFDLCSRVAKASGE